MKMEHSKLLGRFRFICAVVVLAGHVPGASFSPWNVIQHLKDIVGEYQVLLGS